MCAKDLEGPNDLGEGNGRVGQPLLEILDAVDEDKEVVIGTLEVDPRHLLTAASHVCCVILLVWLFGGLYECRWRGRNELIEMLVVLCLGQH